MSSLLALVGSSSSGTAADHKAVPYLRTPFNESQGQFSPDGHWIAYVSDESGGNQIYVQSYPTGAGKFQISTGGGGAQVRWRRDGRELFYIAADGRLMAVTVRTAPTFGAGTPTMLFDPHILFDNITYWRYDVSADGKRFLLNRILSRTDGSASPPITVVLNWNSALKH